MCFVKKQYTYFCSISGKAAGGGGPGNTGHKLQKTMHFAKSMFDMENILPANYNFLRADHIRNLVYSVTLL
jgi:hypothetical protein